MTLEFDIKKDHQAAELERLAAGYEGCGCPDCQQFYKTLDLEKYGKRVVYSQDAILIKEGLTGADKWQEYHPGENLNTFIKRENKKEGVLSHQTKGITPSGSDKTTSVKQKQVVKHAGGRPRMVTGYSKRTEYRRRQQAATPQISANLPH